LTVARLLMWVGNRQPNKEHYVFATFKASGRYDRRRMCIHLFDPTRPIRTWKRAWHRLTWGGWSCWPALPRSQTPCHHRACRVRGKRPDDHVHRRARLAQNGRPLRPHPNGCKAQGAWGFVEDARRLRHNSWHNAPIRAYPHWFKFNGCDRWWAKKIGGRYRARV